MLERNSWELTQNEILVPDLCAYATRLVYLNVDLVGSSTSARGKHWLLRRAVPTWPLLDLAARLSRLQRLLNTLTFGAASTNILYIFAGVVESARGNTGVWRRCLACASRRVLQQAPVRLSPFQSRSSTPLLTISLHLLPLSLVAPSVLLTLPCVGIRQ